MAELDVKKTLAHIVKDTGTIVIDTGEFSSLSKTISNSKITSEYVCVKSVLSNPSAQTADWRITTSNGSVKIDADYDSPTSAQRSAAISGTTSVTLYLNPTTSQGMSGTTEVSVSSFSSLPKTVSNSAINSNHVVVDSVLSNPSAQTADWAVTTTDGSLTIDVDLDSPTSSERAAAISGSTTATLYLTTEVKKDKGYNINLSVHGSWADSGTLIDGHKVYMSNKSYHINNTWDMAKITFTGYNTFKIAIRSYSEPTFDYIFVSNLNDDYFMEVSTIAAWTSLISDAPQHIKAHTRDDNSATNYKEVTFDNLNSSNTYYFYINFLKDWNTMANADRGYFYIITDN